MRIADHVDSDASSWAFKNRHGGDPDPTSSSDGDCDAHSGPDHGLVDSSGSEPGVDLVPRIRHLSVPTLARADLSAHVLIANSAHSSIAERTADEPITDNESWPFFFKRFVDPRLTEEHRHRQGSCQRFSHRQSHSERY